MINTVVFDIGNVLARFGWEEYLEAKGYSEEVKNKIAQATVKGELWKEWDRGITQEAELIEGCCSQYPEVEQEIRAFFHDVFAMVQEFDYAVPLVRNLKEKGYRIYLLSNYSKMHFDHNSKSFGFIKYVDGQVISHEVKHIKPEAPIYESLIHKYGVDPSKAVFLDDVPVNLEGAKPFGFHTILFFSYDQALAELRELGVNI